MAERPSVPSTLRISVGVLVTGGIAAYKVADLVSQLVQGGATVRVAMSEAATRFVGPVTFHGLTGREVLTDLWSTAEAAEPHVELGDWARLILVAPATADVPAKVAHGHADDIVTATVLAARWPVVVAPAMNDAMWTKPAVVANVELLRERGYVVVAPASGRLASGHVGPGRLADPGVIVEAMARAVSAARDLAGRRVVVTAGGTREPIDPVRFVSNYSSGKMGFAVAAAAAARGARVSLISTAAHPHIKGIEVIAVETAEQMRQALLEHVRNADLLVMAAAVADFRPEHAEADKIRREGRTEMVLRLTPNPDLLAAVADAPGTHHLFRFGFAAEGSELEHHALGKLERKRLDAIFANDIRRADIAFGADHNAGVLLLKDGTRVEFERLTKAELADRLLDAVVPRLAPAGRS